MLNILITGGSGTIGTQLTSLLQQSGYVVSHLGRSEREGAVKTYTWDVGAQQMDADALVGVDVIVHLAGAGIGDKPWTRQRKDEILSSRVNSTRLLYQQLEKTNHNVKVFISASAIGYYGFSDDGEPFDEESRPGQDFLATVVSRWEQEVDTIGQLNLRVVKIRTGIVLSEKGGVLEELARPVRYYVGAPLGTGKQYLSWIHLDDLCAIYIRAIEDHTMRGAYNAVSLSSVTNKELTVAIAKVLDKPLFLPPIPAFVLRFLLGEMADLVLGGSKVSADKIRNAGFEFRFVGINNALHDLLHER